MTRYCRRLVLLIFGLSILVLGVGAPFVRPGPDPCLPIGCPSPFSWKVYLPVRRGSLPAAQALVLYVALVVGLVSIARAVAPRWPLLGGSVAALLALVLAGSIAASSSLVGAWYAPDDLRGRQERVLVSIRRDPCDPCDPSLLELIVSSSIRQVDLTYVAEPPPSFHPATSFTTNTTLPSDARDSGYHRGTWHLWTSPERLNEAVWLKSGSTVERWPFAHPLACA